MSDNTSIYVKHTMGDSSYDFLDNKYTKWYFQFVKNWKTRILNEDNNYYENHHIIPRTLGGTDHKDNFVRISGREHWILHWLLTKMTEGQSKHRLLMAFGAMSFNKDKRRLNSRQVEQSRRANAEARTGDENPMKRPEIRLHNSIKRKAQFKSGELSKDFLRVPASEQQKQRQSETMKKKYQTGVISKDHLYGPRDNSTKQKIAETRIERFKQGLYEESYKEKHKQHSKLVSGQGNPKNKLSPEDVIEIDRRLQAGEFQTKIAKDYDITQVTVSAIKNRKSQYYRDVLINKYV